jgi:hypothetical protein
MAISISDFPRPVRTRVGGRTGSKYDAFLDRVAALENEGEGEVEKLADNESALRFLHSANQRRYARIKGGEDALNGIVAYVAQDGVSVVFGVRATNPPVNDGEFEPAAA